MTIRVTARRTEAGVHRFDIWYTPAFRPVHTFLSMEDAYRILVREPSMLGKAAHALGEAVLICESEFAGD